MSIAVITATYNAESTINNLIQSLNNQSDREFVWIVVDGKSSDETVTTIRKNFAGELLLISENDFGIYDALNKGVKLSNRSYYIVVGADDLLHEGAIELYKKAIQETNADIISGNILIEGRRISAKTQRSTLFKMQSALISSHSVGAAIRKDLHNTVGFYKKEFPIAADQHFILSAEKKGAHFSYIDQVVGEYGASGYSRSDVGLTLLDFFKVQLRCHNKFIVVTLYFLKILKNFRRL